MLKRNKKLIILYLFIIGIYVVNICIFMKNIYAKNYLFFDDVNRFSFWDYSFHQGIATILMFLLPILISFISLFDLSRKLKGSYLKNCLLRERYEKFMIKEIVLSYLKAIIPFIVGTGTIFIIGSFLFKENISNTEYADLFSGFIYNNSYSPYYHVFISMILLILFICFIVNLGVIIFRVIRNYNITVVLTFICLNVLNYVMSIIFTLCSYFVSYEFNDILDNFNIYSGYLGGYYINFNLIVILVLFIISSIVVWVLYKDKERVVMDFEH